MESIEIGRLLRAGTTGFIVGCRTTQVSRVAMGSLVRASLDGDYHIYGLIHDIQIDDDGLVRQLVTAEGVSEAIIADNRENRNMPVEISVLAVGYLNQGKLRHLLPPRPPLSLDVIHLCDAEEICHFTQPGQFGYLRHILRARDLPREEILAAHLEEVNRVQTAAGNPEWLPEAIQEIIALLRDDYTTLMTILNTFKEISPG